LTVDALASLDVKFFWVVGEGIRRAIPILLNTTLRSIATTIIPVLISGGYLLFWSNDASASKLQEAGDKETDDLMDFRDLLVDARDAEFLGSTSTEPYENTSTKLLTMVQRHLETNKDNNLS
jgi:hypothetical protein